MAHALGELNIALAALEVLVDKRVAERLSEKIQAYTGAFSGPLHRLTDELALRGIVSNGTPVGIVTTVLKELDAHGRYWVYNAAGTQLIGGPFLTKDTGWNAIEHRDQWVWNDREFAKSHLGAEHLAVVEKSQSESLELLSTITCVTTLLECNELDRKDGP